MRLLLIEENAFIAYDIQTRLNLLGIFSVTLYTTVNEVSKEQMPTGEFFNIALLRQDIHPQKDLINIWRLHNELRVDNIFLTGVYGELRKTALLRATTSLELPLRNILHLPLKQPDLQLALTPYLTPACFAAAGRY